MAACLSHDCLPKMMEHLPASGEDAIRESLALVDGAELYIGVFARRYGFIPDNHDISISEMEYNRAVERGIPRLIFLSHEDHLFASKDFDTGAPAARLKLFREQLEKEQVVAYFRNPESLRAAVSESLAKQLPGLRQTSPPTAEDATRDQPAGPPRREDNPYVSLSAFHQKDAARFFGREALTRETLARFYALLDMSNPRPRFLAILGPSGSGKSSFARAGLMAQLEQRGGARQAMATLVPGEHPGAALTEAVQRACGAETSTGAGNGGQRDNGFPAVPPGCCDSLILLVDQFEEVWSQCQDTAERAAFINALLDAASLKGGPVAVIITLRSDFLAQTQGHPDLNALLAEQSLLVPALTAEGLRAAIAEPASRAGHPLDDATVGQLLADTLGQKAVLPLLQFALSRIWQGMAAGVAPADTLRKLGGVGGALASEAEAAYGQLSPEDQAIARRAFTGMVHLGEGAEDTRRRVQLDRISGAQGADRVYQVLQRFADPGRRLLTLDGEGVEDGASGSIVVEVTHEALFSHWNTLREWLDEGREDIRLQRRLETAVEAYGHGEASLWRPPELSLLHQYHRDHAEDMTAEQLEFFRDSEAAEERRLQQQRRVVRVSWAFAGVMALVAIAGVSLALFFAYATRYGLDVAQATEALKMRLNRDDVALPRMVELPPGSFDMGSKKRANERPIRKVTFSDAFSISATEVTFEQYAVFMAINNLPLPEDDGWGRGDQPVINVNWHEARDYADWLGAIEGQDCGLPTEAEWEYAARAGSVTQYSWGDEIGRNRANCRGCGSEWDAKQAAPVGSFAPNRWELHDMHGNVREWVQDCWHDNYANAPTDGSAWGEENGGRCGRRVLRGGSWFDIPVSLRSASRYGFGPDYRNDDIGFRVVCRPH